MKRLIAAVVALLGIAVLAQAQVSGGKSWKTLTSDNGFEFKYPDCWTIQPDDPDELNESITVARHIVASESKACARLLLNPPLPNAMSFSVGRNKTTEEAFRKNLEQRERNAKTNIARKEWLYFKRFKVGPDDAVVEVELHKDAKADWIRWKMDLLCSAHKVTLTGPDVRDPDPSYFEKFKAGDMAMPEPEKTIFESLRCVESKK